VKNGKVHFLLSIKIWGPRPKGKTLDRKDPHKGYYLDNCKWSTRKEQSRNRTNNTLLKYKGETKCIAEWSEITGLHDTTIHLRLGRGWTVEKTLSTPARKYRRKTK